MKNIRESISTSLSSIFGKQQTRGRYISEGYLYFLSYYSRSYQNLFSDDPVQITSLKNVRGSITLKTYRQGYLYIFSSRQSIISESAISLPCTALFCTIYTVEQSLGVILSIYRFKRDNFLSENVIFESTTNIYKMASILKETSTHANVTSDE